MNECLNCKKEYEAKRPHSKFCSVKCRVMYNRKNPKEGVSKVQMQVLYNSILEVVNRINMGNGQPEAIAAVFKPIQTAAHVPLSFDTMKSDIGAEMSYNEAMEALDRCTSSTEIAKVWKLIQKQKWPSWQLRELERKKEDQRTKIDF